MSVTSTKEPEKRKSVVDSGASMHMVSKKDLNTAKLETMRSYDGDDGQQRASKAKPRRRISACSSTRTIPICERSWTDSEPETYSPIAYPVSKQLSTLLRHGHLPREEDRAIEFWKLKDYHRNEFGYSQHWSDEMWKSKMAGDGSNKKKLQYCTDPSGQEIYLRALQGHSRRNPIDPS